MTLAIAVGLAWLLLPLPVAALVGRAIRWAEAPLEQPSDTDGVQRARAHGPRRRRPGLRRRRELVEVGGQDVPPVAG